MTQWEYKTSPTLGTNLVALGMDGWELVCVDGASMHFKRPMEAPKAEEPAAEGAFFGSWPEPIVEKTEEPKLEMTATAREPAAEPGAPVA